MIENIKRIAKEHRRTLIVITIVGGSAVKIDNVRTDLPRMEPNFVELSLLIETSIKKHAAPSVNFPDVLEGMLEENAKDNSVLNPRELGPFIGNKTCFYGGYVKGSDSLEDLADAVIKKVEGIRCNFGYLYELGNVEINHYSMLRERLKILMSSDYDDKMRVRASSLNGLVYGLDILKSNLGIVEEKYTVISGGLSLIAFV